MLQFSLKISQILHIKEKQTTAVLKLHEEGATIPFIARYRKDQHDNLDEVVIQQIIQTAQQRLRLAYLFNCTHYLRHDRRAHRILLGLRRVHRYGL